MNLTNDSEIVANLSAQPVATEMPKNTWDRVGHVVSALAGQTSPQNIGANIRAGYAAGRDVDNLGSDRTVLRRLYQPVVDAVNKTKPANRQIENPYDLRESRADYNPNVPGNWSTLTRSDGEAVVWGEVEQARHANPGLFGALPKDQAALHEQALSTQRRELEEADKLAGQSGFYGQAAQFVGRAAAGFQDPVNVLGLMLGAGPSKSVLQTFLREGAINAGINAAGMPVRNQRMTNLGQPQSAGDMAAEEAASFVLGGGIPAAAHGAGKLLGKLLAGKEVAPSSHPDFHDMPPSVRAAALMQEDAAQRAADNPLTPDDSGAQIHTALLDQAARSADEGIPSLLTGVDPGPRGLDSTLDMERRKTGFLIRSFDPRQIETDAAAMQYKGGGDAAGVTDRLSGVKDWDPSKAGLSLIWQRGDGKLIVADGHQRLGLARRAIDDGQDVPYYGALYREADGFTAADMRAIAAAKNASEGGSAPWPDGVSLPPPSALVNRVRGLSALGDDAYGMVRAGTASERDGAVVGRAISDPVMQADILKRLTEASPETESEAELFVRQARANKVFFRGADDVEAVARKADPVAFATRDKILAEQKTYRKWLNELRATRDAVATPVSQEIDSLTERMKAATPRLAKKYTARLEELRPLRAGEISGETPDMTHVRSVLQKSDYALRDVQQRIATALSDARARMDAEMPLAGSPVLQERVQILRDALQKLDPEQYSPSAITRLSEEGALSDALQSAAEAAKRTGNRAAATREFVSAVRAAAVHGDFDGVSAGGTVGAVEPAPAGSAISAGPATRAISGRAVGPEGLDLFSDPSARPEALRQQSADLARAVSPPAKTAKPNVKDVKPSAETVKPEFGAAQGEIDALRALPQTETIPDPLGDGEITVADARRRAERDARATEALRTCMLGE